VNPIDTAEGETPWLEIGAEWVLSGRPYIGNYTRTAGSWNLYEERKGKPGWIDTYNITKNEFISDSFTSEPSHNLTFTFVPPTVMNAHFDNVVLKLVYMRTYENAGMINLFICGNWLDSIDTLWKSRMSLYETYFNAMLISTLYKYCTNYTVWDVELRHSVAAKGSNWGIRGNNKFKVSMIKLGYIDRTYDTSQYSGRIR
jgi:hypothetical protein